MLYRSLISSVALAAGLAFAAADAQAFDQSKYPDWTGAWRRLATPGVTGQPGFDQTKRLGPAQQAPLTPEAEAIMRTSMADQQKGGQGNYPTYVCIPPGMPRTMNPYGAMEIVITPETTHMFIEHIHDSRRIFTDGRAWPQRMSSRRWWATPSASGSIPTTTASSTRSKSRPATCAARARSTPPACRCTPTTRPSSRSASISTSPIRTCCSTTSRPSTVR